jgi:hypothetical protein
MVDQKAIHSLYSSAYLPLGDPINQFRRVSAVAEYIARDDTRAEDLQRWFGIFKKKFETAKADYRREGSPPRDRTDSRQTTLWSRLVTQRKQGEQESDLSPDFSAASEYVLNCLQIAKTARSKATTELKQEYIELDRDVRTAGTWLESTFLGKTSPQRNTFLLSYDIEAAIAKTREDTFASHSDRPSLQVSSDILERMLSLIERGPLENADKRIARGLNKISRYGADLYSQKFEQLSYIHHEVSENAMAHAIESPFNDRMNADLASFFGLLFYCQVSVLHVTQRTPHAKQTAIHEEFPSYVGALRKANKKSDQNLYTISYCDTGPGILRHVGKFGAISRQKENPNSIRHMMANQVSTRAFSGSGLGLRKIREFAAGLNGLLIIETAGQTYHFDSVNDVEQETGNTSVRGTMLTIVFPVN